MSCLKMPSSHVQLRWEEAAVISPVPISSFQTSMAAASCLAGRAGGGRGGGEGGGPGGGGAGPRLWGTGSLPPMDALSHPSANPSRRVCQVCGKWLHRDNVRRHMALHTGAENFKCSTCGRKFKWRSSLRSHRCFFKMSTSLSPATGRKSEPQ